MSLDAFYFAINDVRPSLIRVEADEATYNLHILIRFELEQALLADDLTVADLPAAWNEKYVKYLGIRPAERRRRRAARHPLGRRPGRLFSHLFAGQSVRHPVLRAGRDRVGPLASQFARGEFRAAALLAASEDPRHGQRYSAAELVEQITGKPLSHAPLIAHLRKKLGPLYGLD